MGMNSSGAGPDLAGRIEALLPLVEKPARYLGTEIGALQRPWTGAPARGGPNDPLTWLLIMPDVYEIGMSHQGLRILYDILNRRTDALAERAFAPWIDMEAQMRAVGIPLFSLEGRHAAGDFDVIGFSLQYELLATNILNMIDLAGIGLLAKGRGEDDPLIAAGGPCAGNPEPVADFFDFILIGTEKNSSDGSPRRCSACAARRGRFACSRSLSFPGCMFHASTSRSTRAATRWPRDDCAMTSPPLFGGPIWRACSPLPTPPNRSCR